MNQINLPTVPFDVEHMKQLLTDNDVNEVKKYVKQYHFKILSPMSCYFYDVPTKKMIEFTYEEIRKARLTKSHGYYTIVNNKPIYTTLYNWFMEEESTFYRLTLKVNAPQLYSIDGQYYMNLFQGFKWKTPKQPTDEQKKGINLIWNHVFTVLCSKNEKAFNLLKKLICLTIAGQKSKIIIYLRSIEGTGKGIFTNFIIDKVLGSNICHSTGKTKCLESFNGELMGKILLSFQEMRCSNPEAWATMNEELKYLATEPFIDIEQKGKTKINLENILSIWISSNNNHIKISKNDRRYLVLDVSDEKVGDAAYFNELVKYTEDADEPFTEAFYWDAVEYAKPFLGLNFEKELREVETNTKKELTIKAMHPLYKFIKDEYVLKRKSLSMFLSKLVSEFNQQANENKKLSNIEISKLLKEIKIIGHTSTGNKLKYNITENELLNIFRNNNFMHELDEFEN